MGGGHELRLGAQEDRAEILRRGRESGRSQIGMTRWEGRAESRRKESCHLGTRLQWGLPEMRTLEEGQVWEEGREEWPLPNHVPLKSVPAFIPQA